MYLTPIALHGLWQEDFLLLLLRQLRRLESHLPLPRPGLGGIVLLGGLGLNEISCIISVEVGPSGRGQPFVDIKIGVALQYKKFILQGNLQFHVNKLYFATRCSTLYLSLKHGIFFFHRGRRGFESKSLITFKSRANFGYSE